MTGTGKTSEEEFQKVYGLDVVVIPTNRPIARIDQVDLIYQNEKAKFKAIARKIKEKQKEGQPVLVGTVSVEKNELLSAYLKQEGVPHKMLNAKNHEQEGEIIAQAGKPGSVVIATNMAGRGVDIKLGGNPCTKEEQQVKDLGGLFVLGTERHDARRIDDQLRGRAGRQGDPGETQFFVSMDDPIMKIFGGDKIKTIVSALGLADDEAIQNKTISKQLQGAQEKVEGFHFDGRKSTLDYDNVLSYQRNTVYERRQKILFGDEAYLKTIEDRIANSGTELQELIEKKRASANREDYVEALRRISLYVNDMLWMQHLQVMDYTRSSVTLRAYGQREPLVEYKKEGLRLFNEMQQAFDIKVAEMMSRVDIQAMLGEPKQETATPELFKDEDSVEIIKNGEVRKVKKKKLSNYIDAGWKER